MEKVVGVVNDGKVKRSKQSGVKKKKKVGGGGKGGGVVKVVYISNPMKINTSASEFRALVQQLTGQHSSPDCFQSHHHHHGSAPPPPPPPPAPPLLHNTKEEEEEDVVGPACTNNGGAAASHHDDESAAAASGTSTSDLYDVDDDVNEEDVFMPQMEKFSSFWYESSHLLDHQLKRLDASLL